MSRIYLICPVRACTPAQRVLMDKYVADLERAGHKVHYPPRDVDQSNDDGAIRICEAHFRAMLESQEVHFWFDEASYGCHFDAGMAVMAAYYAGKKLVAANGMSARPHKSFVNWIRTKLNA